MDKDTFIKARISSRTKSDFDDICQELGVQPTTKTRELIEAFVKKEYGRLNDRLTVHVYRPSGYQYGAWRIKMRLRNPSEMQFQKTPIPFEFPELRKRRLHPDEGYLSIVTSKKSGELVIGGHFVDGVWEGHLYSNGIEESENPTSIEDVQAALEKAVTSLVDRFSKSSFSEDA
jgi:hypothetical protein